MSSIKTFDTYTDCDGFVNVQVGYNDDLTGDIRDAVELGTGVTGLSASQARELAVFLLKSADRADAYPANRRRSVHRAKRMVALAATGDSDGL